MYIICRKIVVPFPFSSGKAGISPKRQDIYIQVLVDERFLLLYNSEFMDLSLNGHF